MSMRKDDQAAASDNKKYRGNQDKAPSNASEGGTGTCELCNRSNHTTENCYYLKGCREMVTQQRNHRRSSFPRIPVDTSHSISLTMDMAQLRNLNLADK